MNSHRYGKLIAAGLSLLMVTSLAACSDDTSDNSPDKPTDNPTSQATGFAQDANTLVFGVVPDSVDTETNYQPLMDYIALKTGLSVKYYESTDYAALIEAAIAGKIDVASFSGFTYVIATNNGAKIVPISSIVTEAGAEPGYYSEAIVPLNSTITTLADFKGKKVCFVDPSSTSGYLFPSFELLKLGISAENDVTPVFAGKHDISVTKVAQGVECEAGFAEDSQVALSDAVRVIQRTHVPGAPIVVSDTLPDSVKTNLTQALANVTIDQIIAAGVAKADSDAFRSTFAATSPVNDAAYDLIRQICQQTGAKQCQA
ncbi:MAG: phosphate/phosphite/phosphonate ABC transporter substrate-binding protein [Propionibacteriaceae bacterium]|nr:phosphate/phosphite/phosphonate ABC transporter substrate-binding protein [Propionibacteriaceae bacterium]